MSRRQAHRGGKGVTKRLLYMYMQRWRPARAHASSRLLRDPRGAGASVVAAPAGRSRVQVVARANVGVLGADVVVARRARSPRRVTRRSSLRVSLTAVPAGPLCAAAGCRPDEPDIAARWLVVSPQLWGWRPGRSPALAKKSCALRSKPSTRSAMTRKTLAPGSQRRYWSAHSPHRH